MLFVKPLFWQATVGRMYGKMKALFSQNGTLTVTDKRTAIFMSFSPSNLQSDIYNKVEKSLPIVKGLKRKYKRAEFAFDLVNEMAKNGISLSVNGG